MLTSEETLKLKELETSLNLHFNDLELLKHALIHRSFINESSDKSINNNERLEFLGDAILELIVTEYLFNKYPDRPEGELTSFRAATVKTTSLAETAQNSHLGDYIYMSKGEEATGGRIRPYILANTFEALLGATYLDQGLDAVSMLLKDILIPKIELIVEERLDIDSKSKLQEMCQETFNITPSYELISSTGPDHAKIFTMGLKIDKFIVERGDGRNKQEAEQNAAFKAITNWEGILKKYFNK
jgi:ribonuclease-3